MDLLLLITVNQCTWQGTRQCTQKRPSTAGPVVSLRDYIILLGRCLIPWVGPPWGTDVYTARLSSVSYLCKCILWDHRSTTITAATTQVPLNLKKWQKRHFNKELNTVALPKHIFHWNFAWVHFQFRLKYIFCWILFSFFFFLVVFGHQNTPSMCSYSGPSLVEAQHYTKTVLDSSLVCHVDKLHILYIVYVL